jgi:hypothetical protein
VGSNISPNISNLLICSADQRLLNSIGWGGAGAVR